MLRFKEEAKGTERGGRLGGCGGVIAKEDKEQSSLVSRRRRRICYSRLSISRCSVVIAKGLRTSQSKEVEDKSVIAVKIDVHIF